MAITKPVKVKPAKITSIDITSFNGGLDQRGEANITQNSFSRGRNVMVNQQGLATHRFGLKKWLPDTVGTAYEIFPALYNGTLYNITADDGKIKYITKTDDAWIDCGGDNTVTTTDTVNTFLRILDKVLILNGEDTLGYVDLETMEVVHYTAVDDPANAPTLTASGTLSTTGSFKIYYGITFNSTVGETALSPILTQSINKIRDTWKTDDSDQVTVSRNNTAPTGAVSWNLYYAAAPSGAAIQPGDMLPLATGIDLASTTFIDNGTLSVNLSAGTAPEDNSTLGPKAKYGMEVNGRPFLFGIKDDEYAIRIGGDGQHALDFSPTNGGFRLVMNEGTNYYPMSVVGFRNGQGIPSITVLFSNTKGISKQSIVEQNTITYGTFSFVVWGATEQNYGAAGVSSPYGTVNYKGALQFPSTDGFLKMDTQASKQNVLDQVRISDAVSGEVGTIKASQLENIVGTAWNNRVMWSVAARGFTYNNEILVYDSSNPDLSIWYIFNIRSQWIGTISPDDEPAFVYITQDNHIFRLEKVFVAQDEDGDGITSPFPVELTTGLIGSNTAHTGYYAVVQVVFYLVDFIGTCDLTVRYRDQNGKMKTKVKTVSNGVYTKSSVGNWSSPGYLFNQHLPTKVLRWGDVDTITDGQVSAKGSKRYVMPLNVVTNELQAGFNINLDNSAFIARSVSFEGQNLGISPDIR